VTEEILEAQEVASKQEENQTKKPGYILIICIIGILLSGGNIVVRLYGFWDESNYVWSTFNYFAIVLSVIDLVCFIFILRMHKVAVYVYAVFFAIYHVSLIIFGMFSFIGFAIHGVVLFFLSKNLRLMK
jgi:heme/copper-type cytochrome/quinol oxidase subunit 4